MYSGHMPLDGSGSKNMFFWFVRSPNEDANDLPLAIWLNGGPGSSSLEGLFLESGPLRLIRNGGNL